MVSEMSWRAVWTIPRTAVHMSSFGNERTEKLNRFRASITFRSETLWASAISRLVGNPSLSLVLRRKVVNWQVPASVPRGSSFRLYVNSGSPSF